MISQRLWFAVIQKLALLLSWLSIRESAGIGRHWYWQQETFPLWTEATTTPVSEAIAAALLWSLQDQLCRCSGKLYWEQGISDTEGYLIQGSRCRFGVSDELEIEYETQLVSELGYDTQVQNPIRIKGISRFFVPLATLAKRWGHPYIVGKKIRWCKGLATLPNVIGLRQAKTEKYWVCTVCG